MQQKAKVTAGLPSAAKAAKILGVSRKVTKDLASLAERSWKTGEYVIPGFGRLVRVETKKDSSRRSTARGNRRKPPAKKTVKFRFVKAV